MNTVPTEKEIFETLTAIIADALRIDPKEITLESRLFMDLGAESIDIVDICFQIEETQDLKIDQEHLMRSMSDELKAEEIGQRFTAQALVTYIKNALERSRTQ